MVLADRLISWAGEIGRFLYLDFQILLACFGFILPVVLSYWLYRRFRFDPDNFVKELGREQEKGWDRERRRRYGRHQHKHGRHHNREATSGAGG
jgi:predicted amidophosphoribosyltransferase